MTASPESNINLDTLSTKIDAAFSHQRVNDCTTDSSNSEISSFEKMYDLYSNTISKNRTLLGLISISSKYCIMKSEILEDHKLFEAILCSRIFVAAFEFEKHRNECVGQLVWVRHGCDLFLISHNRIIYKILYRTLEDVRREVKDTWKILKNTLKNYLIEALSAPDSVEYSSKDRSDSQSSSNRPVFSDTSSAADNYQDQVRYRMTDEVKELMLDELNSFNLDSRIKQQFVFDLKVLPIKDVFYWRDRLDSLRQCSNCSVVSSQQSPESQRMCELIAKLEKMAQDTATCFTSIQHVTNTVVPETVSQLEDVVNNHEGQMKTLTETVVNLNVAVSGQVARSMAVDGEAKANGEELQKLVCKVSNVEKTVQLNKKYLASLMQNKKKVGFPKAYGSVPFHEDTYDDESGFLCM